MGGFIGNCENFRFPFLGESNNVKVTVSNTEDPVYVQVYGSDITLRPGFSVWYQGIKPAFMCPQEIIVEVANSRLNLHPFIVCPCRTTSRLSHAPSPPEHPFPHWQLNFPNSDDARMAATCTIDFMMFDKRHVINGTSNCANESPSAEEDSLADELTAYKNKVLCEAQDAASELVADLLPSITYIRLASIEVAVAWTQNPTTATITATGSIAADFEMATASIEQELAWKSKHAWKSDWTSSDPCASMDNAQCLRSRVQLDLGFALGANMFSDTAVTVEGNLETTGARGHPIARTPTCMHEHTNCTHFGT